MKHNGITAAVNSPEQQQKKRERERGFWSGLVKVQT